MKTDDLKEELKFLRTRLKSLPVHSQDFDMTLSEFQRVSRIIHENDHHVETLKKQRLNIGNYYPVINQSLFSRIIRFIKRPFLIVLIAFCSISCEEGFDPCNASEDAVKMHYRNMELATDSVEKEKHKQRYLTEKHFLEYCRKNN